MSTIRTQISKVLVGFFALSLLAGITAVFATDLRLVHVMTNSMAPTFHRGDILITKSVSPSSLKVGEIAVLRAPDGFSYSHRIYSTNSAGDKVLVKTKGDANPIADDWSYELGAKKVSISIAQLPTSEISSLLTNKWFAILLYASLVYLVASLIFQPIKEDQLSE